MGDDELDRLDALAQAATPGPWRADDPHEECGEIWVCTENPPTAQPDGTPWDEMASPEVICTGPDDGRRCFADPWMHPSCAEQSMARCPFLSGRRDWSEESARENELLAPYSAGMAVVLAHNWRAHRDQGGAWHFEAIGPLTRL